MAALTATSWTVAYPTATNKMNGRFFDTQIIGKKRFVNLKLTLAATGTVPAGGIPLPAYSAIGMVRNVDYYILRNQIAANFGSAAQTALHFVMNTSGKTVKVYRYQLASALTAASGGRALRSATVAGLNMSGSNVLFLTAVGW